MAALRFVERFLIEENNSYEDLVKEIKNQFPGVRGCSLRSVKRFCSQHGIKKPVSVSDNTLDLVVRSAISEVEPTYLRYQRIRVFSSPGHRSTKIEFVKAYKFSCFFFF